MSDGVDLNVSIVLPAPDLEQRREKKGRRGGGKKEEGEEDRLESVSDTLHGRYKQFPLSHSLFFLGSFPSYVSFLCPTDGLIARLVEHGVRDEDHTLDGE